MKKNYFLSIALLGALAVGISGCTAKTVWEKEDVAKLSDVEKDKHYKKEFEFLTSKLKKDSQGEIIGQKFKIDGYKDEDWGNGKLEKDLYVFLDKKATEGNYYLSNYLGKSYLNGVGNGILRKSLVRAEEWFRVACNQKAEKEYCENQKAVKKMLEKGLK
jgi:TPR repeat protein